jgi:hypothetical protein
MNWRDPWANLEQYRDRDERKAEIEKKARSIQFLSQSPSHPYGHTIGYALALELAESWVYQAEQARFYKALAVTKDKAAS